MVFCRGAAIVSAVDGTPRSDWNPDLNGTVNAIDPSQDGQRVYAAGFFTTENGATANHAAAIQTRSGAPLATPAWNPAWSSSNSYQRAIDQVGDRVYVGGSEHSLFSFSTSTFARLDGNIMMAKGDVQQITDAGGVLYASCHCNQFNYSNAYTWPSLGAGWTQADAIGWFGAYDAGSQTTIAQFTPDMTSRLGSGVWAIAVDSNGRVWAGGDLVNAATKAKASAWSGGFARFSPVDSTAPTRPGHLTRTAASASTVSLSWTAASDDAGAPTYQVLRDDRVVATTSGLRLTVPRGGADRFFVRAADASGNVSASTPVLDASTLTPPTAAFSTSMTGSAVAVDASGSTAGDAGGLDYAWTFGDGTTGTGRTTSHTYRAAGSYHVTLTVTDGNGRTGTASADVTATAPRAQTTVVDKGSTWAWRYAAGPPPAEWNAPGADTSSWSHGAAPLGFGSASIVTDVDSYATTSDRPLAAYFTRTFQVPDTSKVVRLVLDTVADDGVVVYVNGSEVARSNMRSGTVTYRTYAPSARNTRVANASPVTVDVPVSLLVDGTNTVSAETHVNYRATRDMSLDLSATLTTQG